MIRKREWRSDIKTRKNQFLKELKIPNDMNQRVVYLRVGFSNTIILSREKNRIFGSKSNAKSE
jgi:hypothetical protein